MAHVTKTGCFVSNNDANQVVEIGVDAMPSIEKIINEEVCPVCPENHTDRFLKFPGLCGLLVSYFTICDKYDLLDRALVFLDGVTPPVCAEALAAVNVVWPVQIPETFYPTILKMERSKSESVRLVAGAIGRRLPKV
jgi:hypothetical protein